MIKNTKKILAILLAVVMLTSVLTGCSLLDKKPTKDDLVGFAEKTIRDSESVDLELLMTLDMKVKEDGMEVPMQMDIETAVQSHYESETAYLELLAEMNVLGLEMEMTREAYIVDEDGDLVQYSRLIEDGEDTGWLKSSSTGFDFEDPSGNIFEAIDDNIDVFELYDEIEEFDGEDCYLVHGLILGADDMLQGLDMEDLLGEFDYDDIGVFVRAYFLKDTKEPYAVVLDMTDSFAEQYTDEAIVEEFTMTLLFNSFNNIDEIKAPKSVINAVEDGQEIGTDIEPVPDETEPTEGEDEKPTEGEDKPTEPAGELTNGVWTDFKFSLNGHVFTLPCSYEDLKAATGLAMKSSEEKSYLEPNYYTVVSLRTAEDNLACHIDVLNNSEEDATYASGLVIQIGQYDSHLDSGVVLEIAGLKIGDVVSKEKLISMFGEPDDIYEYRIDEDDDQSWVKYETDTYTWCIDSDWTTSNYFEIEMNIHTGVIEEFCLDHSYFED